MRVLVLEPGYCPYIAFFDSAEEAVKKIIQGEKNVALPFGNEVIALVSSEEQDSLPFNRTIDESTYINGRALICGWDGEKLRELSRKQADRYYARATKTRRFPFTAMSPRRPLTPIPGS